MCANFLGSELIGGSLGKRVCESLLQEDLVWDGEDDKVR
jgi:hypothetical protein